MLASVAEVTPAAVTKSIKTPDPIPDAAIPAVTELMKSGRLYRYNVGSAEESVLSVCEQAVADYTVRGFPPAEKPRNPRAFFSAAHLHQPMPNVPLSWAAGTLELSWVACAAAAVAAAAAQRDWPTTDCYLLPKSEEPKTEGRRPSQLETSCH